MQQAFAYKQNVSEIHIKINMGKQQSPKISTESFLFLWCKDRSSQHLVSDKNLYRIS